MSDCHMCGHPSTPNGAHHMPMCPYQKEHDAGYDAAIKDVVAWLDERSDGCCYAGESYSEAIERGEAKGSANE